MHAVEQKITTTGLLTIIRRCAVTGRIESVWSKKNVITYGGTSSIVKLMAPNAALGATVQLETQMKSMRFGTSNVTPQRTDTDLALEAIVASDPVRLELLDANRIIGAAGTVEYTATLGAGDGNGVTYREAGLFTRGTDNDPLLTDVPDATIFSRQVFPDQPKSAAVVLDFRWRITLTV